MRRPLKTYIFAALAAIMIPYVLLHAYVIHTHVEHDRGMLKHQLHENTRLSAGEVEHFLFLARNSLLRLAALDEFASMAQGNGCDPRLANYLAANSNFEMLAVSDAGGRILCTTDESSGPVPRDRLIGKVVGRQDFALDAPVQIRPGKWVAQLAYPIVRNGDAAGTVIAGVDLLYFDSVHLRNALQNADLTPGTTVTVINSDGTVIARWPDIRKWIGHDVRSSQIGKTVLAGNADRFPVATGIDGEIKLYAYTRLAYSDWTLYSGIPVEVFTAATSVFQRNNTVLTLTVALLVGLLSYFISRFITRPVSALAESAAIAEKGDMSVRAPVHGSRELAEMAERFNSLLAARDRAERALAAKQDELRQERNRAIVTLGSIADAVIATDPRKIITYLNPAAEQITGWRMSEAQGKLLREIVDLVDEEDRELMEFIVTGIVEECPDASRLENAYLRRRDGTKLSVADSMACIRGAEGKCEGAVLVMRDVTRERETARLLSWQASHDALTGLLNRTAFEEVLRAALKRVRHEREKCSLLYLDLDRFKVVNDASGHRAGDTLLCQLSSGLREKLRDADILARIGGDEFTVLLENCDIDRALRVAEVLRQTAGDFRFCWEGKCFNIGVSIGVVAITAETRNIDLILSEADAACYRAKQRGRNRVHVFQPSDFDVSERMADMDWVRRAVAGMSNGSMRLYGQTIAPLNGHGEQRCEVLLRLENNGDILVPDTFLPSMERHGMMPVIDRWVIRTLFAGMRDHLYSGTADRFFVNLSGHSLSEDGFLEFILEQFDSTRVSPERICFEVTETTAVVNFPQAREFIGKLTSHGCRFALDDFGSGMASFSYLRNLPADTLKIFGNFVLGMGREPINRAVVEAINGIGHTMHMTTVAESVENGEILDQMREIGVDYIQGFGVEMPIPLEEWRKTGT